jgi:PEP-CTERM motif
MKKLLIAAAIAATGSAQAGVVTLDNFSVGQGPVIDATTTNGAQSGVQAIGGGVTRTITVELLQPANANPLSQGAESGVSGNRFYVSNGSGDGTTVANSNVTLAWSFASGVLSGLNPITYAQLVMDTVADSAGVSNQVTGSLGSQVRGVTSSSQMIWNVSPAALTTGGTISLLFQGNPGWDFSGKLLSAQYTCANNPGSIGVDGLIANFAATVTGTGYNDGCTPTRVPLPGTVALLGIGMLGVAGVRRFKRA